MELVQDIYLATQCLPPEERFGLRSQLCRCSVSIASNIAEGAGRNTAKDFVHFLTVSFSSCYELETQTIRCENLGFIAKQTSHELQEKVRELQKMLYSFKKHIESQA